MTKLALLLFLFPFFHKHPKPKPVLTVPMYCAHVGAGIFGTLCSEDPYKALQFYWDSLKTPGRKSI